MNILPDVNWLNALKLPTRVMLGIFLASVVLLILDKKEIVVLGDLWTPAKAVVIILMVVSGSLSLAGIGGFIFDQFMKHRGRTLLSERRTERQKEREERRREAQEAALDRIEHLSPRELRYLAKCVRDNSQSFYTYVHSPPVTTLMGKGLVYTPGGTHNQDHYPFTIHDFAWKALLERRDEILSRDDENRRREEEEEKSRRRRF